MTLDCIDNAIDKAGEGRSTVPTGPMRHDYRIYFERYLANVFPHTCEIETFKRHVENVEEIVENQITKHSEMMSLLSRTLLTSQDIRDIWTRFSQRFSKGTRVFLFTHEFDSATFPEVCRRIYAVENGTQTWWPHTVKQKMFKTEQLRRLWSHFRKCV